MTLTTEDNVKEFIFDYLKSVILTFEDGSEIKLSKISEIDIDLNRPIEHSFIYITSAVQDADLIKCYIKGTKITGIHLDPRSIDLTNCMDINTFYDISCEMDMTRLKFGTTKTAPGDMYFELEGMVL